MTAVEQYQKLLCRQGSNLCGEEIARDRSLCDISGIVVIWDKEARLAIVRTSFYPYAMARKENDNSRLGVRSYLTF